MDKRFVVVSGLPGSGKSTLAQKLAPALGLPLLDKDTILERLFASKGVGDNQWRRELSRESDRLLQSEAASCPGAVLVSHWRLPCMPVDSGTPTDWLSTLSARVVQLHCQCSAELCTERFVLRRRHPGHLDQENSPAEIRARIHAVVKYGRLEIDPCIEVDTTTEHDLQIVLHQVRQALGC